MVAVLRIFKLSLQQHIYYLQLHISLYNAMYSWLFTISYFDYYCCIKTAIIIKMGNCKHNVKSQFAIKLVISTYQAARTPGQNSYTMTQNGTTSSNYQNSFGFIGCSS